MAKQHDPPHDPLPPPPEPKQTGASAPPLGAAPPAPAKADAPASGAKTNDKGTHVVTFAGQPPVTVTAGSDDEAIKKAAEALGVVRHEARPDVVKVPAG